jgi:5-methylcytosine-specific restriction endonuclease McrA
VRSTSWETKVPAVIMLKDYVRTKTMVRFSKSNVYLRDQYHCQYCNTNVNRKTATLDHVVPVSKGGKTNFENIVTSCAPCNTKKGNRTGPEWRLPYRPYRPGYWELVRKRKQLPFEVKHPSWYQWLDLQQNAV